VKKYVLIFERALSPPLRIRPGPRVHCIGPFDSEEKAQVYAETHHKFPQIWRLAELREPIN